MKQNPSLLGASETPSKPTDHVPIKTQEKVGPSIAGGSVAPTPNLVIKPPSTVATQEAASSIAGKIVEKVEILKSQPAVILQGMSPPVISTVARALASESV